MLGRKSNTKKKATYSLKQLKCPHSNVCLDLGVYSPEFLRGFHSLDRLKNDTNVQDYVNEDNLNSKLQILESSIHDISLTTMLKSQKNDTQYLYDNMVYEYFIGMMVNTFLQTPNVIKTINIFKYKSFEHLDSIVSRTKVTNKELKQCLIPVNKNSYRSLFENSCKDYRLYCIELLLVPYYNDIGYYYNNLHQNDVQSFWKYHATSSLFQLYAFLRTYQRIFTHYDLNSGNFLVSFLPGYYFKYVYKEKGETKASFESPYLVKVIDYAQSVCEKLSQGIMKHICLDHDCQPDCGTTKGYYYQNMNTNYGINVSQDLGTLHFISNYTDRFPIPECLRTLLSLVRYDPNNETSPSEYPYIKNVEDAYQHLLACLNQNPWTYDNNNSLKFYGTFVIQTDLVESIQSLNDTKRKKNTAFKFVKN